MCTRSHVRRPLRRLISKLAFLTVAALSLTFATGSQSTGQEPPPFCTATCMSVAMAAYKNAMDQGFSEQQATELAFEVYQQCVWLFCS